VVDERMILAEENRSTWRKTYQNVTLSTTNPTWTCLEMQRVRDGLKQLGVYARMLLNSRLEKLDGKVRDGFSCLRRPLMAEHVDT
jgi:hypothetical protein